MVDIITVTGAKKFLVVLNHKSHNNMIYDDMDILMLKNIYNIDCHGI